MKFSTPRENLLFPLQQVIGVIERRQTLAILSNVLIRRTDKWLELTGTDLELQLISKVEIEPGDFGEISVPARKLLDICRNLPEQAEVRFEVSGDKVLVLCGRSRFSMGTLPASNFPVFDTGAHEIEFVIEGSVLKEALDKALFCMATQDVRFYLNGLMLEVSNSYLRAVSSDGHRLAVYESAVDLECPQRQVIIPRKGVLELHRLIGDENVPVAVQLAANNIRFVIADLSFSAKLIEARFPDFERVMPRDITKTVTVDRAELKAALTRVSILSGEKLKGVSLDFSSDQIVLKSCNPEHDEAEEALEASLAGEPFNVGFNASYLLEALAHVDSDEVRFSFTDQVNSCLVEDTKNHGFRFVVMPMRL